MLSQALDRAIPNYINNSDSPLTYKDLQHAITDDDGWMMLWHLLIHFSPHLGGKSDDPQKQIYDLNLIPGEYLDSFINIGVLLQKNILLSKYCLFPNILFEQVLIHITACQYFPSFVGTKYSAFLIFHRAHGYSSPYTDETLVSQYEYLETYKAPTNLYLDSTSTLIHPSQLTPHIYM